MKTTKTEGNEEILNEDGTIVGCEYDCDAGECIATDCPRWGKCVFTKDE